MAPPPGTLVPPFFSPSRALPFFPPPDQRARTNCRQSGSNHTTTTYSGNIQPCRSHSGTARSNQNDCSRPSERHQQPAAVHRAADHLHLPTRQQGDGHHLATPGARPAAGGPLNLATLPLATNHVKLLTGTDTTLPPP